MSIRRAPLLLLTLSTAAWAAAGEGSFTPSHLRVPVYQIGLAKSGQPRQYPLYSCSTADCLVDITDEAAVQALLASPNSVEVGTYDELYIGHCPAGSGATSYTALVSGTVEIDGKRYRTTDTTKTTDPLDADLLQPEGEVAVAFEGCGTSFPLPSPLEVREGETVDLALFIAPAQLGYAGLFADHLGTTCYFSPARDHNVCVSNAHFLVTLGAPGSSHLERYFIMDSPSTTSPPPTLPFGASIVLVVEDGTDRVKTGEMRRHFSEVSAPMKGEFTTVLRVVSPNGDGSYRFENFGPNAATSYVTMPAFRRQLLHSGTYSTIGGDTQPYFARRDRSIEQPVCATGPTYSRAPVPEDAGLLPNVERITPLGTFAPNAPGALAPHVFPVAHHYVNVLSDAAGVSGLLTDVLAPGELTITEVVPRVSGGVDQWKVVYLSCREHGGYFDHLTALSPSILAALATAEWEPLTKRYSVRIPLHAGDLVGQAGGHPFPVPKAFDWGAQDSRAAPAVWANRQRYSHDPAGFDLLHTVSALDYVAEPAATHLRAYLRSATGAPLASVGTVAQDIAGTAQGNWFLDGHQASEEGFHLCLGRYNEDTARPLFSVGSSLASAGLPSGVYSFSPTNQGADNRDFPEVVPGQVYCFEVWEHGTSTPPTHIVQVALSASGTQLSIKAVASEPAQPASCPTLRTNMDGAVVFSR